jgi:hypothetical protein
MKRRYALPMARRPPAPNRRSRDAPPASPLARPTPEAGAMQVARQLAGGRGEQPAVKAPRVSHPDDTHERQAERAADAFMRGEPAPRELTGLPGMANMPSRQAGTPPVAAADATTLSRPGSGSGQGMGVAHRRPFERFFGADLSPVRVHDDTAAHASARDLSALAFTLGPNLYFGRGHYAPHTPQGQRLLAHELTHVVQARADAGAIRRQAAPTQPAMSDDELDAKQLKQMEIATGLSFLDNAPIWGGLKAWSKRLPKSFDEMKRRAVARHGATAFDQLLARDEQILPLVHKSQLVMDRLTALAAEYDADQEAAHAVLDYYKGTSYLFEENVRGLYDLSYSYFAGRMAADPDLDLRIFQALLQQDGETIVAEAKANADTAQADADADAEQKEAWADAARDMVGTVVAKREDLVFDDEIELEELLTPAEGSTDADEMVAVARLCGRMAAVMQVGERFHAFSLSQEFKRDNLFWASDWDKYTRIVRHGAGGQAVHTIVGTEGFAITAGKSDQRFQGGDQARNPAKHLQADAKLLESGRAAQLGISPTALFASLVRNVALVNLQQAERAMSGIQTSVTQELGNTLGRTPDPKKGEALQADAARLRQLTLDAERLAQEIKTDSLSDEQRDRRDAILSEMGTLLQRNPAAAFFVKNERDPDSQDPVKDDDVTDSLKGKQGGDAAREAHQEAAKRLENIAIVRRALFDKPDLVWTLEPLHELVLSQFTPGDQLLIRGSKLLRTLSEATVSIGIAAVDVALLIAGFFTGGATWAGLTIHAAGTGIAAAQLYQQVQQAKLLAEMSELDVPGGVQLATPEEARSARNWAIVGAALNLLGLLGMAHTASKLMQASAREGRLIGRIARSAGVADDVMSAALRRNVFGAPRPDPAALRQIVLARMPEPLARRYANLVIDVMDEERWAATFGKESAQHAATRFATDAAGKPYPSVVMFRARGNVMALQEEALHIVQAADPATSAKVLQMAELGVDSWRVMSRGEKLAKMRTLLELEHDVQNRLLQQARRTGDASAADDAFAEMNELSERMAQIDRAIADPNGALPQWFDPNKAPLHLFASPRLPRTGGTWSGLEGDSIWRSTHPDVVAVTKGQGIRFRNGYPDFSEYSAGQVNIGQTGMASDFAEADHLFAEGIMNGSRKPPANMTRADFIHNGALNASATARYRRSAGLTWHHHQGGSRMMLVPTRLHANVPHTGGASGARAAN